MIYPVKILRLEQSKQGALGSLILDGSLFCTTLEPDTQDQVKHQIPQGVFQCKRFHGAKWPDTYEIMVVGHTAVLFHAGNTEVDTQMCILLGQYPGKLKGQRAVLNSGATFGLFLDYMKAKYPAGFDLQIINCF